MKSKKKFNVKEHDHDGEPTRAITFWIKESCKEKYTRLQKRTKEKYCQHLISLIEEDILETDEPASESAS